jgi:hypothetical protein
MAEGDGMTEAKWLACTDPEAMRQFVRDSTSERKRVLYLAAWCRCSRPVVRDRHSLEAVEVGERYADGLVAREDFRHAGSAAFLVQFVPTLMGGHHRAHHPEYAQLLRDVVGNPFRPVVLSPAWLTWNEATVARLAQAAYDERELPSGELNNARLAVLADALEEAGCTDADILCHLRGPGPHVRGCWPVDLCLGKS